MLKLHVISAVTLALMSTSAFARDERPGSPTNGGPSIEQIFQFMDADQDGFIAKDEAKGPLADHFDMIDSDENGMISVEEMQVAMDERAKMEGNHQDGDHHNSADDDESEDEGQ